MNEKIIICLILCYFAFKLDSSEATITHYGGCNSPTGNPGYCVELQQCNALNGLSMKENLSDSEIQHLHLSSCGYVQTNVLVCCTGTINDNSKIRTSSIIDARNISEIFIYQLKKSPEIDMKPSQWNTRIDTGNVAPPLWNLWKNELNSMKPPTTEAPKQEDDNSALTLPIYPKCGAQISSRISAGNQTSKGEYPWLALLRYESTNKEEMFLAEGSLINAYYVLTAAHALDPTSMQDRLISVRLGEWNITATEECDQYLCTTHPIDIAIAKTIIHPDFSPKTRLDDIGLIRLAERVRFTSFIKPICLPLAVRMSLPASTSVEIAGWGSVSDDERSEVKLSAKLKVADFEKCRQDYERLLGTNVTRSQICIGDSVIGQPCAGNGGAPLMIQHERRGTLQVGIVSYGIKGCGRWALPSVFTRVDAYMEWIQGSLER